MFYLARRPPNTALDASFGLRLTKRRNEKHLLESSSVCGGEKMLRYSLSGRERERERNREIKRNREKERERDRKKDRNREKQRNQ